MFAAEPARIADQALVEMEEENFRKAIPLFDQALKDDPNNPAYLTNRGICYTYTGELQVAVKDFEAAINAGKIITRGKEDSKFAYTYYHLGRAYDYHNSPKEAIISYKKALFLKPSLPKVRNDLAWLLATTENVDLLDGELALKLILVECDELGLKDSRRLDTLAACYARTEDYESAILWIEKAIEIDKEDLDEYAERLEIYKLGKPYTEIIK